MEEDIPTRKTNQKYGEAVIDKLTQIDREATKFDFDTLEYSSDCQNGFKTAKDELINKIVNYDLHEYYSSHLAIRKSFFKIIPYENYMKYEGNDSISYPLIKMSPELDSIAVELYDLLKMYMNDKKSSKTSEELVKKYLKICISSTEDIKDEAYVQVLKQLKDNNNR